MPSYLLVTGNSAGATQLKALTRYTFPCGFLSLVATEANQQLIARDTYILSGLYVYVTANTQENSTTVTTRISTAGGGNGTQTLSIATTLTGAFTDAVHTDALATGDLFDTRIVTPAGATGKSITFTSFSYLLTTVSNTTPILASTGSTSLEGTGTCFWPIIGRFGVLTANNEARVTYTVRVATTLSNFRIYLSSNSATWACQIYIRVNGANGNETIAIPSSTSGAFEDITNSDNVAVGQKINFGGGTLNLYCTATTSQVKSNSAGQQIAAGADGTTTLAAALTRYLPVEGSSQSFQATEASAQVTARASFTAKNLFVNIPTNSVDGATTFDLRYTSGNTGLTYSVPASTTGTFEDTTHTYDFTSAILLCWQVVTGGTTGTMVITCIGFELAQPVAPPVAPAFKLKMIPKRPWNRMSRLYSSLSLKGG